MWSLPSLTVVTQRHFWSLKKKIQHLKSTKNPAKFPQQSGPPIYIPTGWIVNAFDIRKNTLLSRLFMCAPHAVNAPHSVRSMLWPTICAQWARPARSTLFFCFSLPFFVKAASSSFAACKEKSIAFCSVEDCKAVPKKHTGMQSLDPQMKAQALHCKVFVFKIVTEYAAGHKSCTSTQIFVEGADSAGASQCLTSGDNCGSFTVAFHISAP